MTVIESLDIIFSFFPPAFLSRLKAEGLYDPILAGKIATGAELYDYLSPDQAAFQDADYSQLATGMVPHLVGKSILEVGCGRGDLLIRLASEGFHPIFGIDRAEVMLQGAERRLSEIPDAHFILAKVEDDPFSALHDIDNVVINNFWELLPPEEADNLLNNLKGCLSPLHRVFIGPVRVGRSTSAEYVEAQEILQNTLGFVFAFPFTENFGVHGYVVERLQIGTVPYLKLKLNSLGNIQDPVPSPDKI